MASRSLLPPTNRPTGAHRFVGSTMPRLSTPQGRRQRRMRWLLPLLLAALPLPALLVACKPTPPEAPVVQGPRRISALGRLEPETRIRKVSVPTSLSGDRVQDILVDEGQLVKKGQPLAVLNSKASLAAALAEAEENVTLSQRKLEQVKAGAKQGDRKSVV